MLVWEQNIARDHCALLATCVDAERCNFIWNTLHMFRSRRKALVPSADVRAVWIRWGFFPRLSRLDPNAKANPPVLCFLSLAIHQSWCFLLHHYSGWGKKKSNIPRLCSWFVSRMWAVEDLAQTCQRRTFSTLCVFLASRGKLFRWIFFIATTQHLGGKKNTLGFTVACMSSNCSSECKIFVNSIKTNTHICISNIINQMKILTSIIIKKIVTY